jgi:glutathione S-transferase
MLLVYFPISGRGELSRLIAKAGGIEGFEDSPNLPEGVTAAECGSSGSLPVLIDGDLKMNESVAIESYLASIAPKYASLTPKQRAKDYQLFSWKESFMPAVAGPLFGGKDKEKIQAACDKFLPILEGILPESGFINGLDYPTPGDMAVFVIAEGYMPFGAAYKHGEVDLSKYTKILGLAQRVKAAESACEESKTLKGSAFGF